MEAFWLLSWGRWGCLSVGDLAVDINAAASHPTFQFRGEPLLCHPQILFQGVVSGGRRHGKSANTSMRDPWPGQLEINVSL